MALPEQDFLTEFIPLWPEETEEAVLARMLANVNEGVEPGEPRWVDPREGTHAYVTVKPGAREIARLYDLAGSEVVAAAFPLWAWGSYLDDHAEVQDVFRLAATYSSGSAVFIAEPDTAIIAGTEIGVPPADEDADAPSFRTLATVTAPQPLDPPAGLAATPFAAGGALATDTYFYVVTAIDLAGETLPTAEIAAAVVGPTGMVELAWDALAGADGYRVYRGTDSGGAYERIAEVTDPAFDDEGAAANPALLPPVENGTGGRARAEIRATEVGSAGNVGPEAITEVLTPLVGVEVTNDAATMGGSDPELDEPLRERLLEEYRGKGAGSARDYRRWARAYPGVGRVTVIPLWNGPGTVRVIVTDANGDTLSDEIVDGLQAALDPIPGLAEGDAPVGAAVTVSTASGLGLVVAAIVEFEAGYSLDGENATAGLRDAIEEAINDYFERIEPGGEVVISQIVGAITSITGVHDVGGVTLDGDDENVAVPADPPAVPFASSIDLTAGSL